MLYNIFLHIFFKIVTLKLQKNAYFANLELAK